MNGKGQIELIINIKFVSIALNAILSGLDGISIWPKEPLLEA